MEETKKLSSMSEIKDAISKKRNEFYSMPENKADNVNEAFSVARRFIYGEKGLKTLPCNYGISKYALAEMIKDSAYSGNTDWNAGLAGIECFTFIRTAISGIQTGESEYLNENNEYVLRTVLSETDLKPEMTEYIMLDAARKWEQKESLTKSALAGWLNKITYVLKNESIPEKRKAAIALYARLVADYVRWRSNSEKDIPSATDSLKILTKDEEKQRLRSPAFVNQIQNDIKPPEKIHANPGSGFPKPDNFKKQDETKRESEIPVTAESGNISDEEDNTEVPDVDFKSSGPFKIIPDERREETSEPEFFRTRNIFAEPDDSDREKTETASEERKDNEEEETVDFFDDGYREYMSPSRNDISMILSTISSSANAIEHFDETNAEMEPAEKQSLKINAQKSANRLWKEWTNDRKQQIISISRGNAQDMSSVIENYAYEEPAGESRSEAENLYEIVREVQDNITSSFNVIQ